MNSLGNILWFLFGGFIVFFLYLFGSLILMITIIGIPFGIQTLKMSSLAISPFGRTAVQSGRAGGGLHIVMNVIWILFAGIELAITHLVLALLCAITIVGIPFAIQHVKLAKLSLVPFGMDIISE